MSEYWVVKDKLDGTYYAPATDMAWTNDRRLSKRFSTRGLAKEYTFRNSYRVFRVFTKPKGSTFVGEMAVDMKGQIVIRVPRGGGGTCVVDRARSVQVANAILGIT